jgi:cyclase
LDVRDGRVVKGKNFVGLADVNDPVELAAYYNEEGADELVFYDITASFEGRKLFTDVLKRVASQIFIPLTVGGGISSAEDFGRVLNAGADKVSVNTSAVKNPSLIKDAAKKYGSQCVVLSMDVKRVNGKFTIFSRGGRTNEGLDALEWAKEGERLGAGELVVNSVDADGVKNGFDLEMLSAICELVKIPVVASGGAGKIEHFKDVFQIKGVDAGLAASIFHYKEVKISDLKKYLSENKIPTRTFG